MKLNKQLRRVAPSVRTPSGSTDLRLTRYTFPVATALSLVVAALLTGAAFATVTGVVPVTVPTILVGWAAAIGLTFALPFAVVRGVVALLERTQ